MGQAEKKSTLYSIRLLKGNLNNVCRRQVYFLRKWQKQFTLIFLAELYNISQWNVVAVRVIHC